MSSECNPKLMKLIGYLQTNNGQVKFTNAYLTNMQYKAERYARLKEKADVELQRQREIVKRKQADLMQVSGANEGDSWSIFDTIASAYKAASQKVAIFGVLATAAENNVNAVLGHEPVNQDSRYPDLQHLGEKIRIMATALRDQYGVSSRPEAQSKQNKLKRKKSLVEASPYVKRLLDKLLVALSDLCNFPNQNEVVETVVSILTAFLKNPSITQGKYINFAMMGPAGTGKSTIVAAMANAFASAGMFIFDQVKLAGRAEFIGEYEGQTIARTRDYLLSSLDSGVIFIDEAYALTPWDNGKPEGYGSEAASALVEFMSEYKGLYCICVAGYEKEIRRYFLPSNPGFDRRIPFKFVLESQTVEDMEFIFKKTLLTEQGIKVPPGRGQPLASTAYFDAAAWKLFHLLLEKVYKGGQQVKAPSETDSATKLKHEGLVEFQPDYPEWYQMFKAQAGSMTNLAEEAILTLIGLTPLEVQETIRTYDWEVMKHIFWTRAKTSGLDMSIIQQEWTHIVAGTQYSGGASSDTLSQAAVSRTKGTSQLPEIRVPFSVQNLDSEDTFPMEVDKRSKRSATDAFESQTRSQSPSENNNALDLKLSSSFMDQTIQNMIGTRTEIAPDL